MSLYAKYIKELKNFEMIEDENGFIIYGFMSKGDEHFCYIEDIYVVPEMRKSHVASKYADKVTEIAREMGIKKLLGSIVPSLEGSHYRQQVLINYGFKLYSSQENFIYYIKEI